LRRPAFLSADGDEDLPVFDRLASYAVGVRQALEVEARAEDRPDPSFIPKREKLARSVLSGGPPPEGSAPSRALLPLGDADCNDALERIRL
jgi:hypothetical protein